MPVNQHTSNPLSFPQVNGQRMNLICGPTIPECFLANLKTPDNGVFLRLISPEGIDQEFSYSEIIDHSMRWSVFYESQNLGHGDRVVIILKHSSELYASFVGALLAGIVPAIFAFPSPKYSKRAYFETIGKLLENALPRLVITYPELKTELAPFVGTIKGLNAIIEPNDVSLQSSTHTLPPSINTADIAFLQYSSGTTGIKKGVAISHRALLWQVEHYARSIALSDMDTIVSWLPLYHDMGLVACFLLPFLTKTPLVSMSPFDWVKRPSMFLQAVTQFNGTICWLPNFAYNFLAQNTPQEMIRKLNLASLRCIVNCSETIMGESHRIFVNKFSSCGLRANALAVSYAMAENTFAVTSGGVYEPLNEDCIDSRVFAKTGQALPVPKGAPNSKVLQGSGKALPNTFIEIVDANGVPLPDRQLGEIVLQSPCLLQEYYHNPVDTGEAIRDGKLYTGDLGYIANGELFVTGRKKDMIIIGGQNIHPQDIEAIVNSVPGIYPGRCVAFGVTQPKLGTEMLVVLAETTETNEAKKAQLCQSIFERIATQTDIVPGDIRLLEHMWLHKSTSGKIARGTNMERYLDLLQQEKASCTVKTDKKTTDILEVAVRNCVTRAIEHHPALGKREIGLDEPLLSSGMIDSLGQAVLVSELENHFKTNLPAKVLSELKYLDSIRSIIKTIEQLYSSRVDESTDLDVPLTAKDIVLCNHSQKSINSKQGFWTLYYRFVFWIKGIRCGSGLQVHGPILLRIFGSPRNLVIGRNVTLMPMVDLKLRENGRITLYDGVMLDTMTRVVAANDARVELGEDVRVGMGTVINGGTDIIIGQQTIIGGNCSINSSEHLAAKGAPVAIQGYKHSPVYIGEGVWLGFGALVLPGSRLGKGAIIGAQSIVSGDVTVNAVALGSPARVIKYRI